MKTVFDRNGNQVDLLESKDIVSSNDYIKFPDGTLIQYGNYGIENAYELTVTFPIPFINTNYSIAIMQQWYTVASTYVNNNKTKQSITIIFFNKDIDATKGSYRGNYIAIGKWK